MDCDPAPPAGQLRRLARAALDQQGVTIRRLRWMRRHTNHLFRADTKAGERLVIRACLPGGRSDAELNAELAWLAALARDTGLTVPLVMAMTAPNPHYQLGNLNRPGFPARPTCGIGFLWVSVRHPALPGLMAR